MYCFTFNDILNYEHILPQKTLTIFPTSFISSKYAKVQFWFIYFTPHQYGKKNI